MFAVKTERGTHALYATLWYSSWPHVALWKGKVPVFGPRVGSSKAGQTYLKFSALLSQSKVEKGETAKMCATSCTDFGGENVLSEEGTTRPSDRQHQKRSRKALG
jgi:hypothetical protein